MKQRWAGAGVEPSLDEILSDPIVHQVMRRDRLSLEAIRDAIDTARDALRRRTEHAAGTVDGRAAAAA